MTESPLSGFSPDYDAYGYDAYSTGAHQSVGTTFADDATGTYAYVPQQPTYAAQPAQQHDTYDQSQSQGQSQGQGQAPTQQTFGYGYAGYDAGYDQTGGYPVYDPYAYGDATTTTTVGAGTYYDTGTYDTSALWQQEQSQQIPAQAQPTYPQADWDSGAYPAYGYGYGYDASGDTGVFEQVQPVQPAQHGQQSPYAAQQEHIERVEHAERPEHGEPVYQSADHTAEFEAPAGGHLADQDRLSDDVNRFADEFNGFAEFNEFAEFPAAARDTEPDRHDYAADGDGFADGEPAARSRRRKPAKRSALLTVAVPSVAVMGVAAVGAAAVAGVGMAQDAPKAQADGQNAGGVATNAPTTQLDRQLAGVSRDADEFAGRASRTQERIDLKDRQLAAKKAALLAAARKEALRPKFLLPVKQKGLSAYFGQAGVNWMALHTGIDFPVQVGTPVMAATDGTVRTQWNSSYGNMAIVTAPDGTETWYCHLSSTKIRSGKVKAGDVIAYSGNTGNTTGPHLHFEVRPNGGAPIDPLPWLLAHGLDPR
ncbi:M23 family metallopeptidase [Streptomyces sp. NBC_01190]|uniref:M23 family metallopeptidase n=1 Tax=Streptomyces sp. NBC_01190 TaxID=2903767 RepID=UPI003865149F|nr:M23 family metallopeptidase [Streptomyces sp. NBC_01190]